MKKTLSYTKSQSLKRRDKVSTKEFKKSVDAYDEKRYVDSLKLLLEYIYPGVIDKFSTDGGRNIKIPHGSIVVNISIEDDMFSINAPFLKMPKDNHVPMLRQLAEINVKNLNLSRFEFKDEGLCFKYECPIELVNPAKIYQVIHEICMNGDVYDDEYVTKFGAERFYEPIITPFSDKEVDDIYDIIQSSCDEAMEAIIYFESERKYGYAWNVIAQTLFKIYYIAQMQGQFLNDFSEVVEQNNREDIPMPETVSKGKAYIKLLKEMPKDILKSHLYYVEHFVNIKEHLNLNGVQESLGETFKKAMASYQADSHMECCLLITYKIYEMYYFYHLQSDIDDIFVEAMSSSASKEWEEAGVILLSAVMKIMQGGFGKDMKAEEVEDEDMMYEDGDDDENEAPNFKKIK